MTKILQVLALLQQSKESREFWGTQIITTIESNNDTLSIVFGDNADCALVFDKTGEKFLGITNWKD
jgi:hypothetical protein